MRFLTKRAAAGVVGLAGIAGMSLGGCQGEPQEGLSATERPSGAPNEGMRGISLQNFRVGDTRWVLHADTASVYRSKKKVEALRVKIDFYEEDRLVSTLTSERGILNQVSDDLEARGRVVVRSTDGAVLRTEVLFWDHQGSRIHTPEYVEITKDGDVLTGVGLEADPGLDNAKILDSVRGRAQGGRLLDGEEGGS